MRFDLSYTKGLSSGKICGSYNGLVYTVGLHVLIVEDDDLLLRLVKLKLEQSGFVVGTAPDGASALAYIQQSNPDVVITELMLPKMDGFQLLRELGQLGEGRSPRVVVCSFRNGAADRLQALKLGAIDFIAKPISLFELEARVTLACSTLSGGELE